MAKRSIQGYVELASGLGELTRSRAKEAAQEILSLAGSDASRKKAAKQVSDLADELLHAAQSNRKHLVRLVRREVETALGKLDVNRLSGDVQTLAATVAGLATQVDDMARSATGLNARTPGPVADALADLEPEPARVVARPSAPAKKAPAKKARRRRPRRRRPRRRRPRRRRPRRRRPPRRRPRRRRPRRGRRPRRRPPPRRPPRRRPREEGSRKKAPATTATKATATKAPATKAPARKAPAHEGPARRRRRGSHGTTATKAPATTRRPRRPRRRPGGTTTSTTPAAGA